MIIARGKQYDSDMQNVILDRLEQEINKTLATQTLDAETVISAIDILSQKVANGDFDELINSLPIDNSELYKQLAIKMLSRVNLEFKIKTELGENFCTQYVTQPPFDLTQIKVKTMPLGVLMHVAAGNADGLPAFSLAEGLITGNINILKLPQADNGLSVAIIQALIDIEPKLADFIYVFDTSSKDLYAIKKMADLSNGIVVWGGESAVAAARKFSHIGAKIIEWGHKLSFAYISGYRDKDAELTALAQHIAETRQLLCSSCQVIYIDTVNMNDVHKFCEEFLPYLERAVLARKSKTIDGAAEASLREYNDRLERLLNSESVKNYQGKICSLTPREDSELELSDMFGNCLVKRLPQKDIIRTLRRSKYYLQTAGLICEPEKRSLLADILARSGVVRITGAGTMSASFCGEAHDGEYPLRRYLRVVNEEVI